MYFNLLILFPQNLKLFVAYSIQQQNMRRGIWTAIKNIWFDSELWVPGAKIHTTVSHYSGWMGKENDFSRIWNQHESCYLGLIATSFCYVPLNALAQAISDPWPVKRSSTFTAICSFKGAQLAFLHLWSSTFQDAALTRSFILHRLSSDHLQGFVLHLGKTSIPFRLGRAKSIYKISSKESGFN